MGIALVSLVAKEFRQTFRDRRMVALLVLMPVIQLVVLGFSVNMEVEHVPTLVADEDRTPESRALVDGLLAGDAFTHLATVEDAAEASRALSLGEAPIAVVVPRGYARTLAKGHTATIQVLVDGGDSNRAIVAQNAVTTYVMARAAAIARERLAESVGTRGTAVEVATVRVEPRIFYNPTLDSQVFYVPGVAATLLLIVTFIVTAMGLAREKEMGTLEQVMVTPISPTALVFGKTIPYAMIGLVDLGLVLGAGAWIFDMPLRGHLGIAFFAGLLYLLATLGLGILVSALVRNQQQALLAAFFIIQPAILLSGFATPVENMPTWIQPVTLLDPVRHFVEVLRAVLLKGATLTDVAPQLVALGGLGLAVFGLSAWTLRRSLA